MTFEQLELNPKLLKGIAEKGYKKVTPIQEKAIPLVLAGKDLLGGAQTGTGKTAAFALPILELLSRRDVETSKPRALVLVPTRELCEQVGESFKLYGKFLNFRITTLFGGVKINPQMTSLENGTDILVATPGRLMDHIKQKNIDLSDIKYLVLDEADRMLDMGFINDIKSILKDLPFNHQNLLFSATYGADIEELGKVLLKDPAMIEVAKRNAAAEEVEQIIHFVDKGDRFDLLEHLIKEGMWYQVLIFVKTKHGADRLNSQLLKADIPSSAIHGDKSQGSRTRALKKFKSGDLQALVATDVAARGIDLHDLSHVVNFELPQIPEDYIHRIGRTGRAGKKGIAISLVSFTEKTQLKKIEKILKYTIPQSVVEGFEPKHDIIKELKNEKDNLKEKIKENKRSRGLKQKTSRTPKAAPRGEKRSSDEIKNAKSGSGKPRFKSTRSGEQHGGQTRSDKPRFKSSRSEENRGGKSRPGKPGFKSSRSEENRGGKSRPGKPGFKSSGTKSSGKRSPQSGKAAQQSPKSRKNNKNFFHK